MKERDVTRRWTTGRGVYSITEKTLLATSRGPHLSFFFCKRKREIGGALLIQVLLPLIGPEHVRVTCSMTAQSSLSIAASCLVLLGREQCNGVFSSSSFYYKRQWRALGPLRGAAVTREASERGGKNQ